jgi:putative transposase
VARVAGCRGAQPSSCNYLFARCAGRHAGSFLKHLLVAIGVNEKILGISRGHEDKTGWGAFLKHLKERGLKGVRLITSDACIGLAERLQSSFLTRPGKGASCHVPSTKVREIAAMLKAIHASEDIAQRAKRPSK